MSKKLELIWKFLQAARRLIKNKDIKKDGILRFAKQEFGEVSQFLRKQIDDLFKAKPTKPKKEGEVVKLKTEAEKDIAEIQKSIDDLDAAEAAADADVAKDIVKKRTDDIAKGDVEGGGIDTIETSMNKIKKAAEELKESTIKPENIMEQIVKGQKVMSEGYRKGNVRTAVRWFMRQEADAGKLKLKKWDDEALKVYGQTTESDPINIFRRYYGEDALDAVDEIGDVFSQGESFNHYAELLRKNVDSSILTPKTRGLGDYDESVVAGEKLRKAMEEEAKQKKLLDEFDIDPDRQPNAYGGIAGTLRLHRTGYAVGSAPKAFKLAKEIRQSKKYKDFIEMLFIKASNMIRQGKGMFKNLDESQRIKQHDNLTQEVTKYQKTGELDEGVYQYFGINPEHVYVQRLIEAEKKTQMTDALKKWDPGKDRKPNAEGGLINILKL